ncbi:hypothetical protein H0E84_09680 [Luteimonas sp. SJ-92]|uniref:Peptidase M12B domain-containing protein n=1 Tax=Luteimonas salinisoli TaxID=2752307 RepID=A0A853JCT7_9GAMM|nr:M12 family metallo-peptidase [Luteimonas salinisoli]NZA26655.1 hypothetical protein [Luteimonas salinisoli]
MKTCILCCIFLLLCSFEAQASQGPLVNSAPRFLDVYASRSHLSKADEAAIERQRRSDSSIDWVIPIKVDPNALNFDRFDAFLYDLHVLIQKSAEQGPESQFGEIWHGEVSLPGDPPGRGDHGGLRDVQLIRAEDGRIYGTIRIGELVYSLNNLSSGNQILTKQDLSRLNDSSNDVIYPENSIRMIPAEEPDGRINQWFQPSIPPIGPPSPPPERIHVIRIAIAFSPAAEGDDQAVLLEQVQAAVSAANASFFPSDVMAQLQIAAYARPSYAETSLARTLSDLRQGSSGPLWLAHRARDDQYADVLAMVVAGKNTWECGGVQQIGSTKATALLVVRRGCLGQGTLAHELGHLMGANHNPENVAMPSPYPYGHGYRRDTQAGNPGWSTIMANGNCAVGCPRLNRWSNPSKKRPNGEPMGTVAVHNNARVLTETKSIVSEFYPNPPKQQGDTSTPPVWLYTPQGSRILTDL